MGSVAIIYFGVLALVIAAGCLEVGSRSSDKDQEPVEGLMNYIIIAGFWPAVCGGFLVFLPFYGMYKLGQLLRVLR